MRSLAERGRSSPDHDVPFKCFQQASQRIGIGRTGTSPLGSNTVRLAAMPFAIPPLILPPATDNPPSRGYVMAVDGGVRHGRCRRGALRSHESKCTL